MRVLVFFFTTLIASRASSLDVVGRWDVPEIAEPSGLCYDAGSDILYAVSDDGTVAAVDSSGDVVRMSEFPGFDFEGIAYQRENGVLLVLDEHRGRILFLDSDTFGLRGYYDIPDSVEGGFEGISCREDGAVVVVNQLRKKNHSGAGITVIQDIFDRPSVEFITTGIEDQSGILVRTGNDGYFIISDAEDRLFHVDSGGKIIDMEALPGSSQEGIAIGEHGMIYIAEDSGGILLMSALEREPESS